MQINTLGVLWAYFELYDTAVRPGGRYDLSNSAVQMPYA